MRKKSTETGNVGFFVQEDGKLIKRTYRRTDIGSWKYDFETIAENFKDLLPLRFSAIKAKFGLTDKETDACIYCLRLARNEAKQKTWQEAMPREIVDWAYRKFDAMIAAGDDKCNDNFRVARIGNSSQMRRYLRYAKQGCCGTCEEVHKGPDGHRYLLGYNYGH